MKIKGMTGTLIVLLAALAGILAYAAAPDITGTWIGKTEVPNQGPDELTLVIKKIPTGYAGTFSDSLAVITKDSEISSVKFEGLDLSFNFPLADGTVLVARLKADGDKLAGTWETPDGGTGEMTFTRKK